MACLFDNNECTLEWFAEDESCKYVYFSILYRSAANEIRDILGVEFDTNLHYVAFVNTVHYYWFLSLNLWTGMRLKLRYNGGTIFNEAVRLTYGRENSTWQHYS